MYCYYSCIVNSDEERLKYLDLLYETMRRKSSEMLTIATVDFIIRLEKRISVLL
jgi:hypothetical protein